jgi:hypothetical protein
LGGSHIISRDNKLVIRGARASDGLQPADPGTSQPFSELPRKCRRCNERANLLLLETEILPARYLRGWSANKMTHTTENSALAHDAGARGLRNFQD